MKKIDEMGDQQSRMKIIDYLNISTNWIRPLCPSLLFTEDGDALFYSYL